MPCYYLAVVKHNIEMFFYISFPENRKWKYILKILKKTSTWLSIFGKWDWTEHTSVSQLWTSQHVGIFQGEAAEKNNLASNMYLQNI